MLTAVVAGQAAMGATARPESRLECTAPPLSGHTVKVDLADDQASGMMNPGSGPSGMKMRLTADTTKVPAGTVSLLAYNKGSLAHEVVVLPLPSGQKVGKRPVRSDGRVDETGSLGEASHNCAADEGGGIAPDSAGWTTLTLRPGRYELVCNFPDHYASGMYAELDVTG